MFSEEVGKDETGEVDSSIPEDLKDTGGRCSDVALVAQSLTLSCLCTNVTLEVKFSWV